jgi:endonuclease I
MTIRFVPARFKLRLLLTAIFLCDLGTFASNAAKADAYDPPPSYYATATGTGAALKLQLYNITISGFKYYSYGDAREALAGLWQDPNNSSNLITLYRDTSVTAAWDSGVTWNREHIATENSMGIKVSDSYKGYGSDLFELAPTVPSDNESRNNDGYGFTGSTSTPSHGTYGAVKGTDNNTYWNPGPQDEGDVARSLFYMATRYGFNQGTAGTIDVSNKYNLTLANGLPNTTGQMGDLNSLLHWAYEDPVNTFERRKNSLVYNGVTVAGTTYTQGDRNPYIDHPEYIWAVFGTKANTSQISVGTPAADGSSSASVNLGRVIAGHSFGTSNVAVNKSGDTPTTFNVSASGSAASSLTGTGETFDYNAGTQSMTVALATPTSAGAVGGSITIDNTDLTSAATGDGAADGNDVVSVSGVAVDHSDASFSSTGDSKQLTLSFGTITQGSGTQTLGFSLSDLLSASGYTAGLDLDGISGTGNTSTLFTNLATFSDQTAGTSSNFLADLDTSSIGSFSAEYTLSVSDENIPGATAGQSLILDLTGTIAAVPEPGSLAVISILCVGLARRRRVN